MNDMYKNILIAIDLNDESSWKKAMPTAIACCNAFGARLNVMTVVPDFGMSIVGQYFPEDYAEKAMAEVDKKLAAFTKKHVPDAIESRHIVATGTIYEEILGSAKKAGADLIVIGSHRPELKDYLIGPNAARVVRHADCSVLVVRE